MLGEPVKPAEIKNDDSLILKAESFARSRPDPDNTGVGKHQKFLRTFSLSYCIRALNSLFEDSV